jgi:hypothetical protein
MRRRFWLLVPVLLTPIAVLQGQSRGAVDLTDLLARVGASVERYYARAQSLMCVETVRIQSVGFDLMSDQGPARQLTYELHVAWDDAAGGQTPEATVERELIKVNNRAPRPKDKPECLDPSAVSPDTLEMLLPGKQSEYAFTLAGRTRVKGHDALMLDYKALVRGPVVATAHEDREDCWKVDMPGRTRGRIWVDADTSDVLRLDEHLIGFVDVTLPADRKRTRGPLPVVFERLDSSIVFSLVSFADPDETLMLPASADSLTVVRNAGVPRVRKMQKFSNYRRFITGGRIVQNQ